MHSGTIHGSVLLLVSLPQPQYARGCSSLPACCRIVSCCRSPRHAPPAPSFRSRVFLLVVLGVPVFRWSRRGHSATAAFCYTGIWELAARAVSRFRLAGRTADEAAGQEGEGGGHHGPSRASGDGRLLPKLVAALRELGFRGDGKTRPARFAMTASSLRALRGPARRPACPRAGCCWPALPSLATSRSRASWDKRPEQARFPTKCSRRPGRLRGLLRTGFPPYRPRRHCFAAAPWPATHGEAGVLPQIPLPSRPALPKVLFDTAHQQRSRAPKRAELACSLSKYLWRADGVGGSGSGKADRGPPPTSNTNVVSTTPALPSPGFSGLLGRAAAFPSSKG